MVSTNIIKKLLQPRACSVYNLVMDVMPLHSWDATPAQAREIQNALAGRISKSGTAGKPVLIAGVDVSVPRQTKTGVAAVVILRYPQMSVVETGLAKDRIRFPYVPGLLSFREAPLVLEAFKKLTVTPDLVLVDGQGMSHPRRIGLASHLGLCLGIPTIGCAKSRLIGEYEMPDVEAGNYTELKDNTEIIGAVVRTRTGVKPMFISIGHMIDLHSAIEWTLNCCRGYRLPEPTRLAHMAAGAKQNH